jgi:hypothetical protein
VALRSVTPPSAYRWHCGTSRQRNLQNHHVLIAITTVVGFLFVAAVSPKRFVAEKLVKAKFACLGQAVILACPYQDSSPATATDVSATTGTSIVCAGTLVTRRPAI